MSEELNTPEDVDNYVNKVVEDLFERNRDIFDDKYIDKFTNQTTEAIGGILSRIYRDFNLFD